MPKDTTIKTGNGNAPRAVAGVASLVPTTSSALGSVAGAYQLTTACDTCGLNLPRKADHQDVLSHPCYRGFSISLTAAGLLSLA